jgi:hypothetical protein
VGHDGGSGRGDGPDWVRHDSRRVELGRNPSGQVPVLSLHVPPDCVVAGEGPGAVGAGDPDALVALPDVGPQVRLISVRALAEGASQFGAWGQQK